MSRASVGPAHPRLRSRGWGEPPTEDVVQASDAGRCDGHHSVRSDRGKADRGVMRLESEAAGFTPAAFRPNQPE